MKRKIKAKMGSPLIWFGGKGKMVAQLLQFIPPHKTYVEVFGGAASLLFAKEPSQVEVYNDIDSGLVNFFRVLRDPQKFEALYRLACLTPYSREEYNFCRKTWQDCEDDVERAYRWFVIVRMSFAGLLTGWGYNVTESSRGMPAETSKWIAAIENLPNVHRRIMRVQVEHKDFRDLIKTYDTDNTFFYCDPPYPPDTRKSGKYENEMTDEDHQDLIQILIGVKGKVMLSSYPNKLYEQLLGFGWKKIKFDTVCFAAGRTRGTGILGKGAAKKMQPRTEVVWLSPQAQQKSTLFDKDYS